MKFNEFLKPIPKAFENASFAANLFEKKEVLLFIFFEMFISFFVKIRFTNFLFEISKSYTGDTF